MYQKLHISHQNQSHIIKIKAIVQLLEFGKNRKNSDAPPSVKVSLHLKCRLFWYLTSQLELSLAKN